MTKTDSKADPESRSLVHLRLPETLIERIDRYAAKMQIGVSRIAPKVQISRNDAVVALLIHALDEDKRKEPQSQRGR